MLEHVIAPRVSGEQGERFAAEERDEAVQQVRDGLGEVALQFAVARRGKIVGQQKQRQVVVVEGRGQFARDHRFCLTRAAYPLGFQADATEEEVKSLSVDR